jgi:hypothetical protein
MQKTTLSTTMRNFVPTWNELPVSKQKMNHNEGKHEEIVQLYRCPQALRTRKSVHFGLAVAFNFNYDN